MHDGSACRWIVSKTNPEYVDYLARAASVSPTFAQVAINRGIKTLTQLNSFLNPSLTRLSDPFDLPGLATAIERIRLAVKNRERVLVHGDYDADGVTAAAIMVEGLSDLGLEVHYFIPHRVDHGYGFGAAGIAKARAVGARLIITVDCGITSFEAVSTANSHGMDVIVTDHHEPQRQAVKPGEAPVYATPDAVAVINPKLIPGGSPLAVLSGAGVALKVMQGLYGSIDAVLRFFDLAAMGTSADVVPLIDDNRIILREGIKLIQAGERPGIKALKNSAGIRSDSFRVSSLAFQLIPRINAAGRIADANDVVRLLTTKSEAEADELAKWLQGLNVKRQEIEEGVFTRALEMLSSSDNDHGVIVLASEGWHIGVVGIVASKIAEKHYRPTFILSVENGVAKGSGRSIPSFDLHAGLTRCGGLLTRYGGHKQAAGLGLPAENIPSFREMMTGLLRSELTADDLVPVLNIDAAVRIADLSIALIDEFARLEPFGCCNEEPLLGARGLEVIQPRIVGNRHLKMHLRQNGRRVDSIGFSFGDYLDSLEENSLVDAAFLPTINEWDGGRYLQLNLKAIRPAL